MGQKGFQPEEILAKLREADILIGQERLNVDIAHLLQNSNEKSWIK